MAEEEKKSITVFGYPIRDWVILVALLGSTATGGALLGGTPGGTTNAIDEQTKQLSEDLRMIRRSMEISSRLAQDNANRIYRIEHQIDSLQRVQMEGFKNLDGYFRDMEYFRGRLDQLRPTPER